MGGAGGVRKGGIVSRMLVSVLDDRADLLTRRHVDEFFITVLDNLRHAGGEDRRISLPSCRSPRALTGRAARHKGQELCLCKMNARREAAQRHADLGIVRASEDGELDVVSVCVCHINLRSNALPLRSDGQTHPKKQGRICPLPRRLVWLP